MVFHFIFSGKFHVAIWWVYDEVMVTYTWLDVWWLGLLVSVGSSDRVHWIMFSEVLREADDKDSPKYRDYRRIKSITSSSSCRVGLFFFLCHTSPNEYLILPTHFGNPCVIELSDYNSASLLSMSSKFEYLAMIVLVNFYWLSHNNQDETWIII